MTNIYPATLENGIVTWGPNGAPPLPANEPVKIEVVVPTLAPPLTDPNDKRTLRELLEELALMNPFRDIEDPVEYIRELRRDRPLGGREE